MKLENKKIFGFFKSCSPWEFEENLLKRKRENNTLVCGKSSVFWKSVNSNGIQIRNSILKHRILATRINPDSLQNQPNNQSFTQKETSLSTLVTSEEVARQIKAATD